MFLTAILASSPYLRACFEMSLRLSSVNAGIVNLITLPSLTGLIPKSLLLIAATMVLTSFLSYGLINNCLGSGTEIDEI